MDTIRLGRTKMMVTKLGFGGIPIQRVSEDEAIAVVKKCLDIGIRYFDTANGYTTSEGRIGKAINGQRREELIIATKSNSRTREGVEGHIQLSLKRLGVDYIDLYQLHNVSDFKNLEMVLDTKGPMAAVEEALGKGIVKHIGVTSHNMDVAKELVKTDRFETIMFPFNFITCEPADELLPLAKEHDVGFIAMKPLAGGRLDNISVAFKYLRQFPDVLPIPGIHAPHEIEEIVQVMERPAEMTEEEKYEMQQLKHELGNRFCRRCDYCQPCSVGIRISEVMNSPSLVKRVPPERIFTGIVAEILEKASDCSECGDCETRCPYHLPIREMMAQQAKWYQEQKVRYEEEMALR